MTKTESVYSRMAKVREELHKTPLRKTGKNQKFYYFELGDFLPQATELMLKHGVFAFYEKIDTDYCLMRVVNIEDSNDFFTIEHKASAAVLAGQSKNGGVTIQEIGATSTYMRRYGWNVLLEIAENDIVDADSMPTNPNEQVKIHNCYDAINVFLDSKHTTNEQAQKEIMALCNDLPDCESQQAKGYFSAEMKKLGFVWSAEKKIFVKKESFND